MCVHSRRTLTLSNIIHLIFPQEQKPCPYIKEMIESTQFYLNRVLKAAKGKYVSRWP